MFRTVIQTFITRFGGAVFNLLTTILVSRYLGSEGKGNHALVVMALAIIHLFTQWFSGSNLVYLASRHPAGKLLFVSTGWILLTATASWVCIRVLGLIPPGYENITFGASLLFCFWNANACLLLGKQQHKSYNLLQFAYPFLLAILVFTGFALGHISLQAFCVALLATNGGIFLLSFALLKPHFSAVEFDRQVLRAVYRNGFFIQLSNATQFLNYRLLYYFIDHFLGRATLGVYSNAISIAESVWMITRSISTVQFAKIANSQNTGDSKRITIHYLFISLFVSAGVLLLLLLLPPAVYARIFGADFAKIPVYLWYLAPGILAVSVNNIHAHFFAGTGNNKVNFYGSLTNLVTICLLFYPLYQWLGNIAPPVVSSVGFISALIFHMWVFQKKK